MPPRKTQTIREVMKESKPIIDQKLGATRSKKVKKNESDEDSDYVNTSTKQKKSNQSSKIKTSTTKQKESIHSDDSQDKLSPELKPSSSRQKTRTKAEKMQDKHNTKIDELKDKQENQNTNQDKQDENRENPSKSDQNRNNIEEENKQNDVDLKNVNGKDQESNQENLNKKNSKEKDLPNENQPNNLIQQQENEHNDDKNKNELSDKEKNKEQQLNQTDNNEEQKIKHPQDNVKNNQPKNESDLKVIPQIIVTAPEIEIKKNQKGQEEEEEKEQQEKQQKATVDIVFFFGADLLNSNSVEYIKNTIEFILEQIKEREKCSSNIKFSIVSFNDIITNQKLQQCQVIDLCDEDEILQNLDEIKQMGQVEVQKGMYYGLKVATQTTKWRRESNNKSFRYVIHIANKQLQLDNQSKELESIISEMNNKNIRYKYLRIDKNIDLDFDGKQYLQNKLNSYEESFLKEFGSLKNVVSGIILRELTHENQK
ncbi:unnamed protein product [Paramecium octaurelia]|uniref:VWFA domain-containing protein n=1 Tax=Paramecium octaurelia TaxID=43137 RepID=A0A8S1WX82_PAROT|nr:unnamed protein product [Paramecium octaurelia]